MLYLCSQYITRGKIWTDCDLFGYSQKNAKTVRLALFKKILPTKAFQSYRFPPLK
ncbi:hypothetical protein SAMN05444369_10428 [Capnocytophaga haemolytica]|uniref:Uncharacterized protein n=1 Tax=Capnocytophaga haemolytica TaxID=45243 RepID=A0AAX2H2P1_9FLAO|nr:hypothetical protein SAMN05444369_10428 [Capnocytophaga haemolytica]SNV16927.1 Uncharacterised protein [Capnocytophaga haemolytica]